VTSEHFKVGIIGLGRISAAHIDTWKAIEGASVVAACDSSEAARAAGAKQGLAMFSDPQAMLDSTALDAVTICAPPHQHQPLAEICFDKGVPVLREKPLAADGTAATALVESAHRHRARFQLATKFRHVPEVQLARQLMADGAVGDPLTFRIEFSGPVDMSQRWNSDPSVSGGGVLIDNGSHALDLARYLFSPIGQRDGRKLEAHSEASGGRLCADPGLDRMRRHRQDHAELEHEARGPGLRRDPGV
jgi:predicted dehydrogenase